MDFSDNLLAAWTLDPAFTAPHPVARPAAGAVSFAAGEVSFAGDLKPAGPEATPPAIWRLDLAEGQAAGEALRHQASQIAAAGQSLGEARRRLEALAAESARPAGAVAFSGPALEGEALPEAERLLLDELQRLDAPQPVSFAAGETPAETGEGQRLEALRTLAGRAFTSLAYVETLQAGRLLATSTVGWGGDSQTTFGLGVSPAQRELHLRSLHNAVRARLNLLAALSIALQGTKLLAKVSAVAAAGPAGALAALPAVWNFINRVALTPRPPLPKGEGE